MPNTLPPPRPVPEVWSVDTSAMSDDTHQVIVRTAGPTGIRVSFLEPLPALRLAEQIKDASVRARSKAAPKNSDGIENGVQE
jgi:hypothetical protein